MDKEIKKLADKMDEQAENANAHDFVITHRALAVLGAKTIGKEATLKLLRAIKKEGGLPGLTGVAGEGPDTCFLARLGISEDWDDWEVPSF